MDESEWGRLSFPEKQPGREFTLEEVALHTTRASCYLVASGRVYDVTSW